MLKPQNLQHVYPVLKLQTVNITTSPIKTIILFAETEQELQRLKQSFHLTQTSDLNLIVVGAFKQEGVIEIETDRVFRFDKKPTDSELIMIGSCSQQFLLSAVENGAISVCIRTKISQIA